RVRSGPFGLDCSAMTFGMVVHCRPLNLRPGGAWAMNALPTALIYSGSGSRSTLPDAHLLCRVCDSKPKGAACTAPRVCDSKPKGAACTAPFVVCRCVANGP